MQVVMYNGHKMVVVVVELVFMTEGGQKPTVS